MNRKIAVIGAGAIGSSVSADLTKAGLDATAKMSDRAEGIERALPPPAHRAAARAWLMNSLPAEKRGWLK